MTGRSNARSVLIVSVDDPWKGGGVGGKHTHIRQLQKGLGANGVNAQVACVKKTPSFKFLHLYPGALRRRLMKDKGDRFAHYVKQYDEQLRRNLRRTDLDFTWVNPHDVVAANAIGERLSKDGKTVPMILTLHGYFTREAASDAEISEASEHFKHYMEIERKACERAWRIVCVDSRIGEYVKSTFGVRAERITVIPNAVDIERFHPVSEEQKTVARQELEIPKDAFIILCPRRLVPKNGVAFAVKAMKELDRNRKALLILAGDGPERRSIEDLVKAEGLSERVLIRGSVQHRIIDRYYAAADAIVIPSVLSAGVEEATSLSMLEGMAAGKPVIVTDIGGLKETVQNGETGVVVRQADSGALNHAVERIMSDREFADRLGTAARSFVEKRHSHTAHAVAMLCEYDRAEDDGPTGAASADGALIHPR